MFECFLSIFSLFTQVLHPTLLAMLSQNKIRTFKRHLLTTDEQQKSEKNYAIMIFLFLNHLEHQINFVYHDRTLIGARNNPYEYYQMEKQSIYLSQ